MRPFARLAACALLATGCIGTSRPSRFYTLVPLEVRERRVPDRPSATLALGPVEIPEVLDRKQIVTRTGANELVLAEFDRWGGSLRDDVERALAAQLAERLAPRGIAVVPRRLTLATAPPDLRASVAITRFDGVLGGSVILGARWEVGQPGGTGRHLAGERTFTERAAAPGYDALVAAMQRAVQRLGDALAEAAGSLGPVPVAR